MKETPDLYGAYPRLDEYQLAELTPLGERRTTSAGEVLQQAGDPPDEFIVVLDGTVAIVQQLGRQDHVVAVHGPHRFLGEIGTLTGQPLFLTAVAQEAGEVLAVPLDRLRDLVSRDPRLADLILRAFLIRRSLQLTLGAGFAIIGSRFSADTRRLREFAARNRLPHHWIDLETDAEAERLLRELGIERDETPVVIWRGEVLRNPDNERLAAAVGLRRATPVQSVCDLIVVGAGPAGLAAAVYGASEGLATVVLDVRGHRRPGGHIVEDRELPRLPGGHQRRRTGRPRRDSGQTLRRRTHRARHRRRTGGAGRAPRSTAGRTKHASAAGRC